MGQVKKKRTILLTGAAGFIGSNVLRYLFKKYPQYSFIVLDALTYSADIRNIPEKIHKSPRFYFFYGDVCNQKLVDHLVAKADTVVHLAAETHVARSIYDDNEFFETDVLGTRNIVNAVLHAGKKIERCIHISTSEVYGTALTERMAEDHPLNPQSPYAAAKAGADRLVYSYYTTYKLPLVIIRPFNIYGPRQHLEKVTPRFITSSILKEPLTVHGTGESSRDFTYVGDLARAIDLVLHAPREKVVGEIFNVGSGRNVAIKDIAAMVLDYTNNSKFKPRIRFTSYTLNIGDRPGQVYRHTADASKIRRVLGWRPLVPFEQGLKRTVDWYLKNQDWWRHKVWMRHVPIETEEGKVELH